MFVRVCVSIRQNNHRLMEQPEVTFDLKTHIAEQEAEMSSAFLPEVTSEPAEMSLYADIERPATPQPAIPQEEPHLLCEESER